MAECFVSARDFERFFKLSAGRDEPKAVWSGEERRSGKERRSGGHDRRWNGEKGRRYRLFDRRIVNR